VVKKRNIFLLIVILLILLVIWVIYSNTALQVNTISIKSEKIPMEFNNFKIAHVSDLHNYEKTEKIIEKLKQSEPDIVAITGDIIDGIKPNPDMALSFIREALKISSVYYVTGNHEAYAISAYKKLREEMINLGVNVLENTAGNIFAGSKSITLTGINDPLFDETVNIKDELAHRLTKILPDNDDYKILLAHRPEYFDIYCDSVDLVLSGHVHGGQFIIPFAGGLLSPGYGFFPKYYKGVYKKDDTHMVVSRGIGNSIIPLRINNNPEIVMIELLHDKE